MQRPSLAAGLSDSVPARDAGPAMMSSVGVWYVAAIAILLLVTAGIYIVYLHQERLEWRDAAMQTTIGQELLIADRDDMLQKVQSREAELSALEQVLSDRETRIGSLETERNELRADVAALKRDIADDRLGQENAGFENEASGPRATPESASQDNQNNSKLNALIDEQDDEIRRLAASLAETGELLVQYQSELQEQEELAKEARLDKMALQKDLTRLRQDMTKTEHAFRRGQIIRGHFASLGEVKPYLADLGPEYWQVIEDWLKDKLQREMVIPDLSADGWSYEGARLLVTIGAPSMVMLLYSNQRGSPVSLTIAIDPSGATSSMSREQAGLNLIEWHDHSHAFILAGEADKAVLKVMASAVQDQLDRTVADSAVPTGRFFRPAFRPERSERQNSG